MPPIISLQDVFFTYADDTEALRNISLDVQLHEIFVLFGPSRSGKSSLLRLLNRLSDLQEGARFQGVIQFDGRDIFDRTVDVFDLRRRISMVFAVPTPLPGTIRENLRYGRLDATDAEIEEAAQLAGAHEFISALPKGYEEQVGEGGVQRVEIAP